jgi:plastocyanin
MRRAAIAGLAALAVAAVVVGCGGEGPEGSNGQRAQSEKGALKVRLTDGKIQPATVTIEKPGEVTFKVRNTGQKKHALRVDGPPPVIMVETLDLRRGQSDTITVDLSRPGKYPWYCPYHRKQGMTGTITVLGK